MSQRYKNPFDQEYPPEGEKAEEEASEGGEPLGTEDFVQQVNAMQDQNEAASDDGVRTIPIKEDIPEDESVSFVQGEELDKNAQDLDDSQSLSVDDEVAAIRKEMEDLKLRQAADMENYKKRLAREHLDQLQYAAEKVLGDLLPTLDNLELAMQYGNQSEACKDLLQGVAMTHKLLLDAVQKHGLTPVGTEGEVFDPAIHEAVGFAEASTEHPSGSVAKVLQRGYKLGNRLLRAAKVMIVQ